MYVCTESIILKSLLEKFSRLCTCANRFQIAIKSKEMLDYARHLKKLARFCEVFSNDQLINLLKLLITEYLQYSCSTRIG